MDDCCGRVVGADASLLHPLWRFSCGVFPVVLRKGVCVRRVEYEVGCTLAAATALVATCWCWCDGVGGWRYKTARAAWLATPVATSLIQCPLAVSLGRKFEVTPEAIAKFFGGYWCFLEPLWNPLEPPEDKQKLAFGVVKI